jgi:hypothetical protein
MNATLLIQFLTKQRIHHPMASGLHFSIECVGDNVDSIPRQAISTAVQKEQCSAQSHLKCVSLEVLPAIAWWCEWAAESLKISRIVGLSASVSYGRKQNAHLLSKVSTFDRMRSSTGVFGLVVMAANFRRKAASCLIGSIEEDAYGPQQNVAGLDLGAEFGSGDFWPESVPLYQSYAMGNCGYDVR